MNAFGRALFGHFALDPQNPQASEFIGSHTSLLRRNLSTAAARRIARKLDFDAGTFVAAACGPGNADHVFLLRHTLMNPWLSDESERGNVIGRYCEYLERAILKTLEEASW